MVRAATMLLALESSVLEGSFQHYDSMVSLHPRRYNVTNLGLIQRSGSRGPELSSPNSALTSTR